MGEVRYMISEAAKKVQVESHVLRYWEDELGLEIGRTDMGHRYYTEDDIQLFLCIQKLKNEGMLLRDLKPMIPELTATRKRLNAARAKQRAQSAPNSKSNTALHTESDESTKETPAPEMQENTSARPDAAAGGKALSDTTAAADTRASTDQNARTGSAPKSSQDAAHLSGESYAPADLTASDPEIIQMTQLEQVRSLIGDVLTDVVSANNETLKKDISRKVTADVIREMDFLFQANERREEEHYRKLDMLIRQQQASRRETAKITPIGKLKKLLT